MKLQDLPYCRMTVTVFDHRKFKFKNSFVGKVNFESIYFWTSYLFSPHQVIIDWYDLKSSATDLAYVTEKPLDLSLRKHAQRTLKRRRTCLTSSFSSRHSRICSTDHYIEGTRRRLPRGYMSDSMINECM